jgi:uncharacterized protein YegP (UPF0339 family)
MKKGFLRVVLPVIVLAAVASAGLHLASAQDKKDKAAPVFEMYKDSADEYRFRFKDDEGTILATSGKGYKTKAECQKIIDAIKRDAPKAKVVDEKKP